MPSPESISSVLPVGTIFVIFFPFFRITQYFVSLIDLLKFFFGSLLILCQIGMMLPRQFTERTLDIIGSGTLGHAKGLVVVSELCSHRCKRHPN